MKKTINLVDKNGSEVISKSIKDEIAKNEMVQLNEQVNVSVMLRRHKLPIPDYIMYFQEANKYLMSNISGIGCKIYMLLMSKANYGNVVTCHMETMAEETKYSRQYISKGINELVEKQIIIKTKADEDQRLNSYVINPFLAWRGTVSLMKKTQRALNKHQLSLPGFPGPGFDQKEQDHDHDRANKK